MPLFRLKLLLLISLVILTVPVSVLACDGWTKSIGTKYATICYSNEKDSRQFTKSLGKWSGLFIDSWEKYPADSWRRVDSLVERVIILLNVFPLDLHFNIHIYQNQKDVEAAYTRLSTSGVFGKIPVAFYSHKSRTIHVSVEKMSAGILAHEIAHAVINSYFTEPLPESMQEILAQYVEKQL